VPSGPVPASICFRRSYPGRSMSRAVRVGLPARGPVTIFRRTCHFCQWWPRPSLGSLPQSSSSMPRPARPRKGGATFGWLRPAPLRRREVSLRPPCTWPGTWSDQTDPRITRGVFEDCPKPLLEDETCLSKGTAGQRCTRTGKDSNGLSAIPKATSGLFRASRMPGTIASRTSRPRIRSLSRSRDITGTCSACLF
jgi:hypothetical protein